ncbi:MAG: mechanosensitive ion channel family protein [Nitrospirae bacterium]|nr:mechanosensitive ion channel family protein [Nitrospirota bacterium]
MEYESLRQIASSLAVFVVAVGVALLARRLLLSVLHRWAAKTDTTIDDILLSVVRGPSIFWAIALGLYLGIGTSVLPPRIIQVSFSVLHALVILSFTFVAANVASHALRFAAERAELPFASTGLTQVVIKGFVITLGVLILLGTLGVSIAPLLTALGVGGLAVALALQDTLSNLFAGIHILMEKSIRVGDVIRLESGEEGAIADIGWRTTRIRLPPNNLVIIPNNKLAQARILNYSLPDKTMALLIPISVSYSADLDQVQRLLIEEATAAIGHTPGLLAQPAPIVRFIPGFGQSSLDVTLIVHVREFADQVLVQHELRLRILKRFRADGVDIPFPSHTVYVHKEPTPSLHD